MRFAERFSYVFKVVIGVAAVVVALAGSSPASAAPYAAMVMDMRDGSVLHSRSADRRQHPASLTKLMTLYLTFEALESGRLHLDQKVTVSRHASRQPASKLYLKAGQKVTIRHLIRATAIKSANDAAMVLAETIGGSQSGFAEMMTAKARKLGMMNSTFRNPHGLTASGHLSTAHDMAILARQLYFDFPEYYNVFGKVTAQAAGKNIRTTNRLLVSYKGAEGMKTGYTRAAGFNLVATAARGQERIIAVVMGGNSSRSRNARVAELLDMGFARAAGRVAVVPPQDRKSVRVAIAEAPLPRARPGSRPTGLAAVAHAIAAPAIAAPTEISSARAPLYTLPPMARPGSSDGAIAREDRFIPVPKPSSADEAQAAAAQVFPGWSVRLGAFADRAEAVESVTAVTLGDVALLSSAVSEISEIRGATGESLYEVRFTGLAPREASKACSALKSRGRDCIALASP